MNSENDQSSKMNPNNVKKLFLAIGIIILFGLLLFVIHVVNTPNLFEQFNNDIKPTSNLFGFPTLLTDTTAELDVTIPPTSTPWPTFTPSPTVTPSPTLDAFGVVGIFLTQTSIANPPSSDNPMLVIEQFATQTSVALTATSYGLDYQQLFAASPTSKTPIIPSATPNSILLTLTANSNWQTAQVATIQATVYPVISTAAANMIGTATAIPTSTPTSIPVYPTAQSFSSNPRIGVLDEILNLFDESLDDGVFIFLLWLLPSLIAERIIRRRLIRLDPQRPNEIDIRSFLLFYAIVVSLSFLNDTYSSDFKISEILNESLTALTFFSILLSVCSIFLASMIIEMAQIIEGGGTREPFINEGENKAESKTYSSEIHFLQYGSVSAAPIAVFFVLLLGYINWGFYGNYPEIWLSASGAIIFVSVFTILITDKDRTRSIWDTLGLSLSLPMIGLFRMFLVPFGSIVSPKVEHTGWGGILFKFSTATILLGYTGPIYYFSLMDPGNYLPNLSFGLPEYMFFFPLLSIGQMFLPLSTLIEKNLALLGTSNFSMPEVFVWSAASVIFLALVILGFESISRAIPSEQKFEPIRLTTSRLTRTLVDIIVSWYLISVLFTVLLEDFSSGIVAFAIQNDNFRPFFVFILFFMLLWGYVYTATTVGRINVSRLPSHWLYFPFRFVSTLVLWPLLLIVRTSWELFKSILSMLFGITFLAAIFAGTFPDILRDATSLVSDPAVERLISIVHVYDPIYQNIELNSFISLYFAGGFFLLLTIWTAWGVYLKQEPNDSNELFRSAIKYLFLFFQLFIFVIISMVFVFFVTRYINLLLFILPATPVSSLWLIISYYVLAILFFVIAFSYLLKSDLKVSLSKALSAPIHWFHDLRGNQDSKNQIYERAGWYLNRLRLIQTRISSLVNFIFLPYPFNKGQLILTLPWQSGQRKIKYSLAVGEGFYLEQSILLGGFILIISGFSILTFRDIQRALLFAISLFGLWFFLKQSCEFNLFQSYKRLMRLLGTSLVTYVFTWLIWNFIIPVIYMILLAIGTRQGVGLGTVRNWLSNNPPYVNIVDLIFLLLFWIFAKNQLLLMWRPIFGTFFRNISQFLIRGQRRAWFDIFKDGIKVIRTPQRVPEDLPASFFVAWGIFFYVFAGFLVFLSNRYARPEAFSLPMVMINLARSSGVMFISLPFIVYTAANPVIFIKYYHSLLAPTLERLLHRKNFAGLDFLVSRLLLFPGYRKTFQYFCLTFFFAHGLASLFFEPVRALLWQYPAWSTLYFIFEIFFFVAFGTLLVSNYVRISPVLTIFVGMIYAGISFFIGMSTYRLGFMILTLFIFIVGLGWKLKWAIGWFTLEAPVQSILNAAKKALFNFDAFESAQMGFSNLVLYSRNDQFFDSTGFPEKFHAEIGKCSNLMTESLLANAEQSQDPIWQSLLLYAYSNFEDFQKFSRDFLEGRMETPLAQMNPKMHGHLVQIISRLLLMSRTSLDETLRVLLLDPNASIDISPIIFSDILPLPHAEGELIIADFPPEERELLEVYLNKDRSVSDVLEACSNFKGDNVSVRELYSLYSLMHSMNQVALLEEIATFSLSIQGLAISTDSVFQELHHILQKIVSVAEIVARASIQRPTHRSHEYSFALKQIQIIGKARLVQITEREHTYIFEILDLWASLLTESLIYEPSLPRLSLSVETAWIKSGVEEVVVILVVNEGDSTATDVQVEIHPSASLHILSPQPPLIIDEILGRSTVRLELNVLLTTEDDVELKTRINYGDLRQKYYSTDETISIIKPLELEQTIEPFDENITNPYVYGPAVTDTDHFFGREKTLLAIEQRLRDSQQISIIMLYGQRRMGKSSILKKVNRHYAQTKEWWPIYIDGATIFSKQVPDLMRALAVRIWSKLPEGHHLPEPDSASFQNDPGHALVNEFLPSVDRVVKENGRMLLILFDEFDTLIKTAQSRFNHEEVQEVLWVLREFAQQMSTGGFIYAGTYELLDMSRYYHAPLFNLAEQIKVGPLEATAARELIRVPGGRQLQFSEDAINKIMRLSGCHPYFIQLLCNKIFDAAVNENVHIVGTRLVNKALIEAQEQENAFFNIWSERSEEQKLTLSALAQIIEYDGLMAPVSRIHNILEFGFVSIEIDMIQNAIDRMVQEEILHRENDMYGFSVDLLRLWIKIRKPLTSVRAEIGYRI